MRRFPLCHAADMYIITHQNRILDKLRKPAGVYYRSVVHIGKINLCYCCRSPLFIKPAKIIAKFALQVCGSKKTFAIAEVQKITAKVPQTCGIAVADYPLLFCGICGCRIECKFLVHSSGVIPLKISKLHKILIQNYYCWISFSKKKKKKQQKSKHLALSELTVFYLV